MMSIVLSAVAVLRHSSSTNMISPGSKAAILALVILWGAPLLAQDDPRVALFGGYSLAHMAPCSTQAGGCGVQFSETPESSNFNGWNSSLTYAPWKGLGLTADFSGYYGTVPFTSPARRHASVYDILFGPTWTFTQGRMSLFVHGLVGVQSLARSQSDETYNQNGSGLAWALGGGLDVSLHRHISVRFAQLDYLRAHLPADVTSNEYSNGLRYSGGIVFKF